MVSCILLIYVLSKLNFSGSLLGIAFLFNLLLIHKREKEIKKQGNTEENCKIQNNSHLSLTSVHLSQGIAIFELLVFLNLSYNISFLLHLDLCSELDLIHFVCGKLLRLIMYFSSHIFLIFYLTTNLLYKFEVYSALFLYILLSR